MEDETKGERRFEKTLGHCLAEGLIDRSDVEAAVSSFLADSSPVCLPLARAYATLPSFEALPPKLRKAIVEIALLARV